MVLLFVCSFEMKVHPLAPGLLMTRPQSPLEAATTVTELEKLRNTVSIVLEAGRPVV